MDIKRLKSVAFAMAAGLALGAAQLPALAQGHGRGDIQVPDTSIEGPFDRGFVSHTNHLILLNPAKGLGPGGGMTPAQMQTFYALPTTGGQGVIAIVDAYDYPAALSDFNTFSKQFGLPRETSSNALASSNKVFQVVYQGGTKPRSNTGWAQEAALDIEWAHAMAPGATIVLVEAQSSSFADLFAAVDIAAKIVGVKQVSMSWGGSEYSGEMSSDIHFNVNGICFFAASGDSGGKTIYPSTSPYVVAVGGTSVATTSAGGFLGETGWSGGGGGNSPYESKPSWQSGVGGSNRSVPDISSNADPNTGVSVYGPTGRGTNSGWLVFGGTSVSAPCMAGMVNLGGGTYTSTFSLLTNIYSHYNSSLASSFFRDITVGNNGFKCTAGWDYVTGVGSPQGTGGFRP